MNGIKRFLDVTAPMCLAALIIFALDELGVMYWYASTKVFLYGLIASLVVFTIMVASSKYKELLKLLACACLVYGFFAFIRIKTGLYTDIPRLEVIKNFAIVTPIVYIAKWVSLKVA